VTNPPPYYGPPPGQPAGPPPGGQNTQGLVGMIVGIVALPLVCCGWIGSLVGIVGAIFSWLGLQKAKAGLASNRSQAMAGLICSAVAIVLGIAITILSVYLSSLDWQTWLENNSTTTN
jgi:uncharacterized membrane protein